jgi:hypothetical protein
VRQATEPILGACRSQTPVTPLSPDKTNTGSNPTTELEELTVENQRVEHVAALYSSGSGIGSGAHDIVVCASGRKYIHLRPTSSRPRGKWRHSSNLRQMASGLGCRETASAALSHHGRPKGEDQCAVDLDRLHHGRALPAAHCCRDSWAGSQIADGAYARIGARPAPILSGPPSSSSLAGLQGGLQALAITHIFPRRINALPASSRSCSSVLSCLKALHVK